MKEATTHRKNPAWWVWLFAASFLLQFGLVLRNDWVGPTLGARVHYDQGSFLIADIYAPSTAVPLRPGDRIIRADGQVISSDSDWFVVLSNLRVGQPIVFEIQRDDQTELVSVTPGQQSSVGFFRPGLLVVLRIGQMMMLGVACFVAFARPRNGAALLTALFFAGMSMFNVPQSVSGFAAMYRDLPPIVVALLFISMMAGGMTALFLFLFCVTFPRRLIRSSRILALLCMPQMLWFIPQQIYAYRLLYDPARVIGMFSESFYLGLNITAVAYFVGGPLALALNYRRLSDVNERRRVQVLVLGLAVGLFALVSLMLAITVPAKRESSFGRFVLYPMPVITTLVILAFLVFPASFAYAVLRHRLFDVRLIVRQGLQYGMARSVLLSALPLLASTFLFDISIHRQESLAAIMAARGLTYAVFGSVAVILYWKRQEWLDGIDRRFFRDRYDTQRVLQQVVLDVKQAKNFEGAAGEVVKQVHAALHPEFVSVLPEELFHSVG
jgi:PDZ domain